MFARLLVPLASLAVRVTAQAFEPVDFNVTAALEKLGVDVSELPQPAESLPERSLQSCALACSSLNIVFGNSLVLPEGASSYDTFTSGYWSAQQGALSPACVFRPSKSLDVSMVVLLARMYQCPFAVKGGGHAAWAGASSIEGGIAISMENFKQATVAADKQTVDIGPGLRWIDVYKAVEVDGLSVVGGRMAPVGVPGLILGGGIAHFSNKRGWACDNVASFELVTASGMPITVSATSYSDLYWALRGGGNNFGIVTNFKLNAFPQGDLWGGQRLYLEDQFTGVLDAITEFAINGSPKDLDAAQIVTFASGYGLGKLAFANLHYAKPIANASIFSPWANLTAIQDTTGLRPMSGMANLLNEGAQGPGAFESWWGISLKMDRSLLKFVTDTFYEQDDALADVERILFIMAIQPITAGAMAAMQKNGGNALGLNPSGGPYFVMNFNAAWNNAADEATYHRAINTVIKTVKAEAQRRGLDNDFVYLNYASEYQDPIGSYGAAKKARLQSISKKYDPAQVFQTLQPGGYKVTKGAPNPASP